MSKKVLDEKNKKRKRKHKIVKIKKYSL